MKKELIKRILQDPKAITSSDIDLLISHDDENQRINSSDLKSLFLSIYDLNNTSELGQAHEGLMGRLNRRSNKRRNKNFFTRIKKDISHIKIYAEGDSWFQHPLIKDIIDQINKCAKKEDKKYAVYSSAMGGEWWINIIEDGDYLPEISKIKPDVILLSGAGNDIVGGKKLSNLVNPANGYFKSDFENISEQNFNNAINSHSFLKQIINIKDDSLTKEHKQSLIYGLTVISKEFYSLMWTFELMYKFVIQNIRKKFPEIKIITQGYDYPIPSYKKGPLPLKFIVNWFMNNGHWLADALNLAGVEKAMQKHVTFTLIYVFNEIIISIVKHDKYGANLFHIDSRGATNGYVKNWYDEMHVKPKIYKKIAKTYLKCIKSTDKNKKVYKVIEE